MLTVVHEVVAGPKKGEGRGVVKFEVKINLGMMAMLVDVDVLKKWKIDRRPSPSYTEP